MNRRKQRPYERKQSSRKHAVIFGMGLAALLVVVAILVYFALNYLPGISRRIENLPYYARTYYRKLIPQPEYLPTPAPTAAVANIETEAEPDRSAAQIDPPVDVDEIMPAEVEPPAAIDEIPAAETQAEPAAMEIEPAATTQALPAGRSAGDTIVPQPTPTPTANPTPRAESIQLTGFTHQWQTWNNCGPATVTMGMSYFGRPETQADAAKFLKPNQDDKNVNPHELAAYARTTGLEAIVRQGGTIEQLKLFLSNDIPVIAETWLVHDGDGLGHYRLLTGYDDTTGRFNTFDSLNGPDFKVDYAQFDSDWRVFNRLYVVAYPPEKADIVTAIIGPDMDDEQLYQRLVAEANAEIAANPDDAIAHFNRGDALARLERYQEATAAFDRARQIGLHWRRLWYQFTPFEAYFTAGRYQDVLDLAQATIAGTGGLEEAYYYQGLARQATNQSDPAESFEAAIAYNPNFSPAAKALERLNGE